MGCLDLGRNHRVGMKEEEAHVKATHRAYDLARRAVLSAQGGQTAAGPALVKAELELRTAEEAVAVEVQAAWDRNRQAVAHAKTAIVEARREQARVEVAAGTAARSRDPRHPVLNEDERAAVTEARAQVDVAVAAHADALATFKDGVTVEQLEVTGAV